ncbi:hypothetical protein DFH08DRAFT_518233 [Mycena albidolilacea]|uniref:DUF6534 domain-containing protein n=1 Tax=Mycena albidolilacea TaxID=1033008 RepID=A0AAD6Z3M3_9AGAR|nr:hypothetical protein DFH08DRAFT_518233 [Mycena albidolilacea]
MASPLDSTMGVWLVSLFLGTILYGMGLIQTYLYFHWYTKDHWGVKAVVICLLICETLQITFFFCATYWLLIDHFGDFNALVVITWHESVQLLAGYLSVFIVQMYFAYCIYALLHNMRANPKYKIMPIFITALALLQIGAGIAQTAVSTELGSFTLLYQTKGIATLQAASALVCDVSITGCFCYTLNSKKSTIKSTNSLLNMLMINAVNRGMLTAFTAALHIILFLSFPNSFWFSLALVPSGKLYMNSMLATLNTREHIRQSTQENSVGRISISLGNLSSNPSSGPTNPQTPADTTMDISSLNGHNSHNQGKKYPFTANMV